MYQLHRYIQCIHCTHLWLDECATYALFTSFIEETEQQKESENKETNMKIIFFWCVEISCQQNHKFDCASDEWLVLSNEFQSENS